MSTLLNALFIRLKCQRHELHQRLLSIEQQISILEQKLHEHQQKISNSCIISALILPEQEIARVHFITHQQHQQDELTVSKATLLASQKALKSEDMRLNTELKMLEKHQETKRHIQQQKAVRTAQNNRDEWTLQRREFI